MNLSKIFLSLITSFFTTCVLLGSLCYAQGPTRGSFMDLDSSVKELQSLVRKNSRGIVSVAIYDDTGALINSGSGFFIDNEGRIITNASIWKDAYSAEVLSDLNSYSEVSIINRSYNLDIALIKVKAINETPLELDFNYKPTVGERVVVIGKLSGLTTLSEGLISSLTRAEEDFDLIEIQTTASILNYEASKDGPVLNTSGSVIGIASDTVFDKKMPDRSWRGFNNDKMYAESLQPIRPLISQADNVEHLHPARSKIWYKWFVNYLKSLALKGFLYLYGIGFNRVIAFLFVSILIFYVIEWFYVKYIRHR